MQIIQVDFNSMSKVKLQIMEASIKIVEWTQEHRMEWNLSNLHARIKKLEAVITCRPMCSMKRRQ